MFRGGGPLPSPRYASTYPSVGSTSHNVTTWPRDLCLLLDCGCNRATPPL